MNEYFTPNNWNYSQFQNQNLKAIISLGCDPDILGTRFSYFVTVLDEDDNEVYQEEFMALDRACEAMNSKYGGIWEYKDLSKPSSSGCDSCSAH